MAEREKFWLVWSVSSPRSPIKRHRTLKAASIEAARLAVKFPSQEFVVVESVAVLFMGFRGNVRREFYPDGDGCMEVGRFLDVYGL